MGAESQVAVATTLTSTTAEARSRFSPLERGCYFEGELQGCMRVPNRMAATENPTECLSLDRTEQSVLILFDHFCSSSTCRESFIGEKFSENSLVFSQEKVLK